VSSSSPTPVAARDPKHDARAQVLQAARAFFDVAHAPAPFVAGTTYIPVTAKVLDVEDLVHLIDASLDLWLTSGRYGTQLEQALPARMNRQGNALLVNSGSSANLIAISSLGAPMLKTLDRRPLAKGDEVITVAAGFPTTVNPIFQNGWVPVFVDVDFRTLDAQPETIMAARTPKTRAVVLAHTLGNPYRADILADWCRAEGLYLVEDCCDALGATISTGATQTAAPVGSFGDFATLSFYPAHHITTGEGGAVIPADGRWKRVAESMRDWGRDCWCDTGKDNTCGKRFAWEFAGLPRGYDHKYVYSNIGYNAKMTDMQAAIGLSQLAKLDRFIAARRANWHTLYDGVTSSPRLRAALIPVEPTAGTEPSWFGFPLHCADGIDRERLTTFLEEHKVGTRLMFGSNLTRQPAYRDLEFRIHGELTASDEILKRTFWIGVHPALDQARLGYMLEQLEAGVRAQR
jgi:CDP-6-deoxy-D-xylo-4-hexulose-3-dehydrase